VLWRYKKILVLAIRRGADNMRNFLGDKMTKQSLQAIFESFGRNYTDGECCYCPSTHEDCKKCPKMIKTISRILKLLESVVPEEKQVEPVSYDYKGLKCPYCDTAIPNEEVYIWNACIAEIKGKING
jgi:hypothetical protein